MANTKNSDAQIFKNPILESLTRTSPLMSILIYGTCIICFLILGFINGGIAWYWIVGLFLSGMVFWTFSEYFLHRYMFHWVTEKKWTQRFHFIIHGAHHDFPTDKARLLMPPVPGLILANILFTFFYTLFWLVDIPQLNYGFFAGFFLGYLLYSFVHRSIHIRRPPKGIKDLWFHHHLHHHRFPDKAFGVSSMFWDRVFGTMPPEKYRKANITKV